MLLKMGHNGTFKGAKVENVYLVSCSAAQKLHRAKGSGDGRAEDAVWGEKVASSKEDGGLGAL